MNAKSEKKDAALKLVRYMGTKEFGDKFSELLGNISPIKGVAATDPMLAQVAKLNESSAPYIMVTYFRFQEPTGSDAAASRGAEDDERPDDAGPGRQRNHQGHRHLLRAVQKG